VEDFSDLVAMSNAIQEIIVRKSLIDKVAGYFGILFLTVVALLLLIVSKKPGMLLLLAPSIILFFIHDKEFRVRTILLKISPDGLWTPKHGYKPWSNIKSVRVKFAGNRRPQRYIEVYRGNPFYPDEVIDLGSMNMLPFHLKRELRKYTRVD
jgi:hypothetical protein